MTTTDLTADTDTFTATHEAGHCVIRIARGMPPFRTVTLDPDNGAAGYVDVDPQPVWRDDLALYAGAGPAAEFHLLALRQGHDDTEAATVAALEERHASEVIDYASPWAEDDFGPSEVLEAAHGLGPHWAPILAALVADFWPHIEAVAAALLDRRTLTYAEVATILASLPTPTA